MCGYEGEWDQGCVPCRAGYYKNSSGTQGCLHCDKGSFLETIASSSEACTKCDVGSFPYDYDKDEKLKEIDVLVSDTVESIDPHKEAEELTELLEKSNTRFEFLK